MENQTEHHIANYMESSTVGLYKEYNRRIGPNNAESMDKPMDDEMEAGATQAVGRKTLKLLPGYSLYHHSYCR